MIRLLNTLDTLYSEQIGLGVISAESLQAIQSSTPIYAPQHYNPSLMLQYNPTRAVRGLPEHPNPNPTHVIPYKGGVPCFCCLDNIAIQWPNERGIDFAVDSQALIFLPNIAPVFGHHFTVVDPIHRDQISDTTLMLKLSTQMPGYWIVQNGVEVGATNPWHFHLQAFKDNIPLHTYPTAYTLPSDLKLSRVHHPATIYRLSVTTPCSKEILAYVGSLEKGLHAQDPQFRLNTLVFNNGKTLSLYWVMRHLTRRTDRYKTGQPGYAEAAGVISTITPDAHTDWKQNGWKRYIELMEDISLLPDKIMEIEQCLIYSEP